MSNEKIVIHRTVFQSWGAFIDGAENGKTDMREGSRSSFQCEKDWSGVENRQEAFKLAREGWAKGTADIKNLAMPLFNHVSKMIERLDVNHDIEGHAIDVARFVDGEPEAWLKFENVIQESENGHKLIRIVFNCSASAGVDTEVINRKGAAVAALVELLEYTGHRVELILVHASEGYYRESAEQYVRLKEFDQNLDLNVLAFALAHPSTLRVLTFSVMEQMPADARGKIGVPGSYGRPTDIIDENQGDVYIGKSYSADPQWESTELAEKWVIENLKKQGISLDLTRK